MNTKSEVRNGSGRGTGRIFAEYRAQNPQISGSSQREELIKSARSKFRPRPDDDVAMEKSEEDEGGASVCLAPYARSPF